jgi:predicted nucleotide-binding protein (sugar kinase/HSP70/actin superfamily)
MMEWTLFVQVVAIPIVGWLVYMVTKTKTDLTDHKIHVAENYVLKEDAEKAETKIYDMLKTVNGKLDRLIERKVNEG